MANKKKVLIGSADPDFAFGLKSQLEAMGAFSPVVVTGARELIEIEQLFYFSVILVDAMLDDYPGFEVCRKLRETGRDTPILLFSRISEQECAKVRNSWQADRCLVKSIPVPDLFERIREVIESKARTSMTDTQPGKRPSLKEEKFDGLEEIVREELFSEISPEAKAEPESEAAPPAEKPEPREAPRAEEPELARLAPVAPEPPGDFPGKPGPEPESPPEAAPPGPKPLEEEIAGKFDELVKGLKPKDIPASVPLLEPRRMDTPIRVESKIEEVREPETLPGREIMPEPEPAEEIETVAEEDIIEEGESGESGRSEAGIPSGEIPAGETQTARIAEARADRKREVVIPPTREIEAAPVRLVPWALVMKTLLVLAGLGFGLGYFIAK